MICSKCGKNYPTIAIAIKDLNGEKIFCPNCLITSYINSELNLVDDPKIIDDVSGKNGAVEFISENEHYNLHHKRMLRLIAHNLLPEEYRVLANKYGSDKYEIHDDFYSEYGIALQPVE